MTELTDAQVKKVAKLARLKLSTDEIESVRQLLSEVLGHFQTINNIDTKNLTPLLSPALEVRVCREDRVNKNISSDEILATAKEKSGLLYQVPPVV